MVEFQEEMKYDRSSGVHFGPVDFVKYAEAFGAKGLRATSNTELEAAIQEGLATDGPVVIDIPIDYTDNKRIREDNFTGSILLRYELYKPNGIVISINCER